jgi:hypothetical protein
VAAVTVQLGVNVLLLHREFGRKLGRVAIGQPPATVAQT